MKFIDLSFTPVSVTTYSEMIYICWQYKIELFGRGKKMSLQLAVIVFYSNKVYYTGHHKLHQI